MPSKPSNSKRAQKENPTADAKKDFCPLTCLMCNWSCRKILTVLVVLVLLRAGWLLFAPIGYEVQAPAATAASACPTTDTLKGTSHYETAPTTSSAAALAAANSLLQSRADTQAGLAFNGYTCPNPNCPNKTQGPVTATPDAGNPTSSRFTLWAMLATAFDLFSRTYWSGLMNYSWQTTVTCR